MSWFQKLIPSKIRTEGIKKRSIPEGLWTKCEACNQIQYRAELQRNLDVCPKCGCHNRISARRRLDTFLDPEPRVEIGADIEPLDVLKFKDSRKYRDRIPLVCFSASGGARMQEALFSLMQMAKTSAALAKLKERRIPYVSVMTDPTMGGVSASLAMLGDINIGEPNALIGFAGPR